MSAEIAKVAESAAPLLLKPHDAARVLAISPRQLWALTKKGVIPCIRLGHCLRYDATSLREWIQQSLVVNPSTER
jgi:hypothetical protein